ncbi:MAG: DHH family phosphoesterase [Thermoplasmata archaeon]|nr:DHH family phosphoesterase [Thermoplasmata archaeon]
MSTSLKDIAAIFDGKKVLVLPHANADPDALASALGLSLSLPDVTWGLPDGMNRPAKAMLASLGLEEPPPFVLDDHDRILCVDSSLPQMLGPYSMLGERENVAVLDHHAEGSEWGNALYHSDETKGSCAEQVYDLLGLLGVKIPEKAAMAICCGIYADTAGFRYATLDALRAFIGMAEEHGFDALEVSSMLSAEKDISERISNIKAAQRIRSLRTGEFILLSTRISAFEGSSARLLLGIGADVAFVGSQNKEKVRVSGRARKKALDAGLHLGHIFEGVAEEAGGSGGGHDGAAGLNTTGDVEAVLHVCMEKTREYLRSKK